GELVVEVEVGESLARGESGGAGADVGPGGFSGGDLAAQDSGEVVLVGPALGPRLLGQHRGGLANPGRLERAGEVVQLLGHLAGRRAHQATCPSRSTPKAAS